MDLSTRYPNTNFSWFAGYTQLTVVFLPGDKNFGYFPEVPITKIRVSAPAPYKNQPSQKQRQNPVKIRLNRPTLSASDPIYQEPREGHFSKGGFCKFQCHVQESRKIPKDIVLGPAVHLALSMPQPRDTAFLRKKKLTCFHASFFPFCPLSWPPLFLSFSWHLFALSRPSESALFCRVMGTAQSLTRGILRMDIAKKFGKEIPSRTFCVKKGQKSFP